MRAITRMFHQFPPVWRWRNYKPTYADFEKEMWPPVTRPGLNGPPVVNPVQLLRELPWGGAPLVRGHASSMGLALGLYAASPRVT